MDPDEKQIIDKLHELIEWSELPILQDVSKSNYSDISNKDLHHTLLAAFCIQYEQIKQLSDKVDDLSKQIQNSLRQ